MHRFRYEPIDDFHGAVYIDDKKVRANAVDVRFRVDEIPSVKISLLGNSEIDTMAEIQFTDENLLSMVRRRIHDEEFLRELVEVVKEELGDDK